MATHSADESLSNLLIYTPDGNESPTSLDSIFSRQDSSISVGTFGLEPIFVGGTPSIAAEEQNDLPFISTTLTLTALTTATITQTEVEENGSARDQSSYYLAITSSRAVNTPLIPIPLPTLESHSPYFTTTPSNATVLTNAIFSHPAIVAWLAIFGAFLFFAGMVWVLQKVMRRVRAKRWMKKYGSNSALEIATRSNNSRFLRGGRELAASKNGGSNNVTPMKERVEAPAKPCEFAYGADVADSPRNGVDSRNGSWSRSRDRRINPEQIGKGSPMRREGDV